MKRYITVLALSALVCSSCSDFLDVQPEGNATTTSYFLNDQQAIDAIDGLYERFHQEGCYGRELFWEQGAACDIVWGRTRGYNSLATLAYTGDESPLRDVFSRMYSTMSRANWIIQELVKKEKGTTLTAVEKRSLGEAYFSRGWAHYLIAYRYGTDKQGVPFVRYEDFPDDYDNSIPPQQATVMDNYKLIMKIWTRQSPTFQTSNPMTLTTGAGHIRLLPWRSKRKLMLTGLLGMLPNGTTSSRWSINWRTTTIEI